MFLSSVALFNSIKTKLAALRYSQTSPDVLPVISESGSDPLLFEAVAMFSSQNLELAIKRLKPMGNRICIIVPVHDDYRNARKGNSQSSERSTAFMLVISDRDLTIDAGQMQSTLQSAGILAMKDLAIAALTARDFQVSDKDALTGANITFVVALEVGPGAAVQLEWEQGGTQQGRQTVVGRECWNQVFTVPQAGVVHQQIGRH